MVATEYRNINELAALIILLDRFMDDLPSGSDLKSDIERLRGDWELGGAILGIKWNN